MKKLALGILSLALVGTLTAPADAYSSNRSYNSYGSSSSYGSNYGSSSRSYGSYGTGSNLSSTTVRSYTRSDGTYVDTHQRSTANSTQYDNWSTRGNTNPNTGQRGTKTPRY